MRFELRTVVVGTCSWLWACAGAPPDPDATSPTTQSGSVEPGDDDDTESDPTDTDTEDTTDTDTTGSGGTSLAVTFSIDPDVASDLGEPAVGTFYGQVFRSSDVSAFGPAAGAVPLGEILVEVDLPADGSATEILYRVSPVGAGDVAILGFVDVNGNADPADLGPDRGEPVTWPDDNRFGLTPDEENVVEVFFGLLNPL